MKYCLFLIAAFYVSGLSADPDVTVISDGVFDRAWSQAQNNNQRQALQNLVSQAEAGDPKSVLQIVSLLLSSESGGEVLREAEVLLSPLAQSGRPEARFLLAKIYLRMQPSRRTESVALLQSLVASHWLPAMLLLADLEPKRAEALWARAAGLGNAQAQFLLADLLRGKGQDVQSNQWLNRAAVQNYLPALKLKAFRCRRDRLFVESVMWYSRAVELGDTDSMLELAALYLNGHGVRQDVSGAVALADRALGSELQAIQYLAGKVESPFGNSLTIYQRGFLLKHRDRNPEYFAAKDWYLKAALQGYLPAFNGLGVLYENGLGVKRNHSQARAYYKYAAAGGYERSMLNLAELSLDSGDLARAEIWLRKTNMASLRRSRLWAELKLMKSG